MNKIFKNKKVINIGDNIRKFRELKNITRDKMADELGLSLSGYSKIERNEIDLTIHRLQQIAGIIGTDVSKILNFDSSQILNVLSKNHSEVQKNSRMNVENMSFYPDEYKDKYIKILEKEVSRLKKIAKED